MKMNNRKKILGFEAGVIIMTLITIYMAGPISMANIENDEKIYPSQPNIGDLMLDLGGPYVLKGTFILNLEVHITGGTPPYNFTVDWGDGSPPENYTDYDDYILIVHKYECRKEPYRLTGVVIDSKDFYDKYVTTVTVICCECDISVSVIDNTEGNYPFWCEGTDIPFKVIVRSAYNKNFCTCDKYEVWIKIASSTNNSWNIREYGPIDPGDSQEYIIYGCQACGPGMHTVTVKIVLDGIVDDYPGNNEAEHTFTIVSGEICYFLQMIWCLLHPSKCPG